MELCVTYYPLVATVLLTMGACATLSVLLFSVMLLFLYLRSKSELTMLHKMQTCMRALVVVQTVLTVTAVAMLSAATSASGLVSGTISSLVAQRQAASVLKAAGATLIAGYAFFATEHQTFRWLALVGGCFMAGVDAVDMIQVGQMIGLLQASRSDYSNDHDPAMHLVARALGMQYAVKVFSFFSWLLVLQIIGCLMHALGWFVLNELPNDEEVAGHLTELARATINRRIQEKRKPEEFDGGSSRHLFKPTDKLELIWDQMTDGIIGRENRMSHPISTNPRGYIQPEVQKELCEVLLKMGVKRSQIYEVLDNEDEA